MGKNSGFATKESPFAHVRLWSELEDLPLSMGTGLNRVSADELGKYLGKFFGWPVVTLEQVINVERTVMYRPTTPTETEGTDDVPH